MERDVRIDNIKGALMLLVVLGHLLETGVGTASPLYRMIYSFHMPAFLMISGVLARVSKRRILLSFLPIYALAQLSYLFFEHFLNGRALEIKDIFTPYWHLWYIFVLMGYLALLPFMKKQKPSRRPLFFGATVLLSLAFPFVRGNLYPLSIGRFFAFLPFFTFGALFGVDAVPKFLKRLLPLAILALLLCKRLGTRALYGSFSYDAPYDLLIRALLILSAFSFISLLLSMPCKPLPFFASVGKSTLSVYLLHGFFVKALRHGGAEIKDPISALIIGALLCLALSCKKEKKIDTEKKTVYNKVIKQKEEIYNGYQG